MRSTTGKKIVFTLQRTPIWAWAGLKIEPMTIIRPNWGVGPRWPLSVEVIWWDDKIREIFLLGSQPSMIYR